MLVTQVATNGDFCAEGAVRGCHTVETRIARWANLGQHLARDPQNAQQFIVPVECFQVHEHGSAGIGDVGEVLTAVGATGQVPDDPGIDVAEERIATFGGFADAFHIVQNPLDFGAGEVGGNRQARFATEEVAQSIAFQLGADAVGACVLPDDGVVVGLAGRLVPHDGCFALVGDANGRKLRGVESRFLHGAFDDVLRACPNFQWVMFDPTGLGVDLLVFELVFRHFTATVVEHHEAGAGGSLVDSAYILAHADLLWSANWWKGLISVVIRLP